VLSASSVPHGAPDYEELEDWGLEPEDVLDFRGNGNSDGPPHARIATLRPQDNARLLDALREVTV
jgi:hypothetical protein